MYIVVASTLIGLVVAVTWFGAPPVPAAIGALGASLYICLRHRPNGRHKPT
jgi:hypothetical protein